MKKILFVCHGNICRSPMAEFVFKELVRKAGLENMFRIDSAATSCEELGNPVFPPVKKLLKEHGIPFDERKAVRMRKSDYDEYDLIVAMDGRNLRGIENIIDMDTDKKVHLLMEFAGKSRDVADPYYSGDFEATWKDVQEGCSALFDKLKQPVCF